MYTDMDILVVNLSGHPVGEERAMVFSSCNIQFIFIHLCCGRRVLIVCHSNEEENTSFSTTKKKRKGEKICLR